MHPSLTAEFNLPPRLEPKEKMERNEPCWCGSGEKWKRCHRDRHLQESSPIGKLIHEMQAIQKRGVCLHVDAKLSACADHPIRAHTVQRRGGLAAIAEDGHVISGKRGFEKIFKNEGEIVPERIGVAHASTFMGFCGFHDNSLFEPIEQANFDLDEKAAFLLAYRAIAYEFLTKRQALEAISVNRKMDKGKNFETQIGIQQYVHLYKEGLIRGMQDLSYWKRKYDEGLASGSYSGIKHYAIRFGEILPFVCCGSFMPEVSFEGKMVQILTRSKGGLDHVCMNISSMNGQTFVVLAWLDRPNGPAEDFVRSFSALPDASKANMCLHLACEHIENTYFRPSWWISIGNVNQLNLIERMRSGTAPLHARTHNAFLGVRKILDGSNITSVVRPNDF